MSGTGDRLPFRQQKKQLRQQNGSWRATLCDDATSTLKPTSAGSSTSLATSVPSVPQLQTQQCRRRTLRLGGFVAVTTALKSGAFLIAVFYFFGAALLVGVVSLGSFLLLVDSVATAETNLDKTNKMWTVSQFETIGALHVDDYVRYLVTKLAILWRCIASLHKSAVNYSFTVSIAGTPSLVELQDLLEGRVPLLLTYDVANATDDECDRSRGSSIASTVSMEDRNSMILGMEAMIEQAEIQQELEEPEEEVYYSIEGFVPDEDDDFFWSEAEEEPEEDDDDDDDDDVEDKKVPRYTEDDEKRKVVALRSVLIPVLPLLLERDAHASRPRSRSASTSSEPLESVVMPLVKPLILNVNQVKWVEVDAPATPQLPAAPPTRKRRISVNMTTMKPLPRLVVKARPSTLTPPENVQRMLNQVERMMREVHELLAFGNEVLGRSSDEESTDQSPSHSLKNVRFCDDVKLIERTPVVDADYSDDEDEDELRSSLHYLPEEIEFMSNEFFNTSVDDDLALSVC